MHKKLLIPGPTEVSPQILQEQTRLMIGHRSKEFSDFYGGITSKLAKFFELPSDYKPTTTTSSGTLWFDIVGRCIVKKKALCCLNGAFSQRFGEIVRNCGKEADFIEAEWGSVVKPEAVAEKLETGEYDTVAMCHNESSTGARSPVAEVGKLLKKDYPDVMFTVDSVSSMGGDWTLPHEMGVDILFASTQKCFALPPGLAIAFVNEKAWSELKKFLTEAATPTYWKSLSLKRNIKLHLPLMFRCFTLWTNAWISCLRRRILAFTSGIWTWLL